MFGCDDDGNESRSTPLYTSLLSLSLTVSVYPASWLALLCTISTIEHGIWYALNENHSSELYRLVPSHTVVDVHTSGGQK